MQGCFNIHWITMTGARATVRTVHLMHVSDSCEKCKNTMFRFGSDLNLLACS